MAALVPNDWPAIEILGAAGALVLAYLLSIRLDLIWTPVPWWIVVMALVPIAALARRVPAGVASLWLLGLTSYAWSLAPGDTLLASVWGLVLVASAAAGKWRTGLVLTVSAIVANGLLNALSMNAFGLQTYLSGSVHYRLGQMALVLVPVAMAGYATSSRRWALFPWWALATLASFAALISGSRGVYVPFAALVAAAAVRLARNPRSRRRAVLGLAVTAALIVAADRAIPFHPVSEALSAKASIRSQRAAVGSSGNFTNRLRFWEEGLDTALSRPLGVGLGGYRSTVHAYQRFPMLWSSSPHNVFVETVATTGWPGLALLIVVLGWSFWKGWTSGGWPWALALAGIWFALSVDITADYPSIMSIAFATMGASLGPRTEPSYAAASGSARRRLLRWPVSVVALVVIAGSALSLWWLLPCYGPECSLARWRGVEYRVLATVPDMPADARSRYFERLSGLYPKSLWVMQLEQQYASTPARKLVLARRIALSFPFQSWKNYLTWANLSVEAGDVAQAKEAVRAGLKVFGPTVERFPGSRGDRAGFEAWLVRAQAILGLQP